MFYFSYQIRKKFVTYSSEIEVAVIRHVDRRGLRGRSLHLYEQSPVFVQLESHRCRYCSWIALITVRADQSHHHTITFDGGVPHLPAPTISTTMETVLAFVLRYVVTLAVHNKRCFADAIRDATDGGTEIRIIGPLISWKLLFITSFAICA